MLLTPTLHRPEKKHNLAVFGAAASAGGPGVGKDSPIGDDDNDEVSGAMPCCREAATKNHCLAFLLPTHENPQASPSRKKPKPTSQARASVGRPSTQQAWTGWLAGWLAGALSHRLAGWAFTL